ncbi:hypothetical protein ACEPAF_978 [Sanghuangporus sanghuang]
MRDLRTQTAVAAAVVQDEPQDYPIVEDSPVDIYKEEPARTALFDEPAELPSGSKRKRALPKKFRDHVPSSSRTAILPSMSLPHLLDHALPPPPIPVAPSPPVPVLESAPPVSLPEPASRPRPRVPYTSPQDDYGLYRVYPDRPIDDPDSSLELDDVCDAENFDVPLKDSHIPSLPQYVKTFCAPFDNISTFLLTDWANREVEKKTYEEIDYLVQNVLLHPDFKIEDLRNYIAKREHDRLDNYTASQNTTSKFQDLTDADGWREGLTVYKALDDPNAPPFHYSPYREYWNAERVYGELYSCDAWLEAHEEVQAKSKEDGIENSVLPILLYSDSTHLANFGTASLWPLYMYLGGHSRYVHGKTSESTCHHLAYIPSLPASIQDEYKNIFGRGASAELFTYLRRQLMQAILSLVIFQPEFLEVYTTGVQFRCSDNVTHRLFPRIMIYSADYPERMLVATLRNMGAFSCPKCLIRREFIHELGTTRDNQRCNRRRLDDAHRQDSVSNSRRWIFESGYAVDSGQVKGILGDGSLVPIHNAFSVLSPHGFNFYDMYRSTPTFGNNTIRRFPISTAALSKLAARDYEDLLQCSIPVFEDLRLDERHNKILLDLLFVLVTWHAYAKLRIHTETTVRLLETCTKELGKQVRLFKKETSCYNTRELQREVAAHGRRYIAMVGKGKGKAKPQSSKQGEASHGDPKRKILNINTPKFHALGEYAQAIRRFGTTDSYSTQIGESQHKRVKRMYGRTNKRNAAKDVSKLEGRGRALNRIKSRMDNSVTSKPVESLSKTSPSVHYHMPASQKDSETIGDWIHQHKADAVLRTFRDNLRFHLLGRILNRDENEVFASQEISGLYIRHDKVYWHKVLRVNYTTYDMRRQQDSCNPNSRADVMLLSADTNGSHPYMYARIVRLFHLQVAYSGPGQTHQSFRRMDVAWVRWFHIDSSSSFSISAKRLPQLRFPHYTNTSAFGFINPDLIVRATHVIPKFSSGKTRYTLPKCIVPSKSKETNDYLVYYVNIFVDRDMFMRYRGGGIGHLVSRHLDRELLKEIEKEIEFNEGDGDVEMEEETTEDQSEVESEDLMESEDEEGEEDLQEDFDNSDGSGEDTGGGESDGYAEL